MNSSSSSENGYLPFLVFDGAALLRDYGEFEGGFSKIEGSQATARQTPVLLRSVVSQQRIPYNSQAAALIDAVRAVGEQLVAANPVGLAVGNIVRRVLHIIREEDLSLTTASIARLNLSAVSDDEAILIKTIIQGYRPLLSAAARSTLRPPSLQTLLEYMPDSTAVPYTSSSGDHSGGKNQSADKSTKE